MRSPNYGGPSHYVFVFSDRILPIAEAGLMVLIDDGRTVDDMRVVEPALGRQVRSCLWLGERFAMLRRIRGYLSCPASSARRSA